MNKGLTPISYHAGSMIVANIRRVVKEQNGNLLSQQAYRFINLCSGFIAHYNLFGFRAVYEDGVSLGEALLKVKHQNQWNNFRPGEKDYAYYMSKRDVFNRICKMLVDECGLEEPLHDPWRMIVGI